MSSRISTSTLAALIVLIEMGSTVFGQVDYGQSRYAAPESYRPAQYTSWPPATATSSYAPEGGELAQRVADLEASLKSMKDKEKAAEKKAAGKPTVKVGGRVHLDCAGFDQDPTSLLQGRQLDGCEFRRVWIHIKGEMFDVFDYKVQYDLASTDTVGTQRIQTSSFKDVYMGIKDLPFIGRIRVGHFWEPFSIEQLTGNNDINFMERSTPVDAMSPDRNTGIMLFNTLADERITWRIGGFVANNGSEPPVFQPQHGGLAVTGRLTTLLWYDEAAPDRGLWHVGAAFSYRDMDEYKTRFRSRPEAHLATYVVDTGTINDVADVKLVNFETAYVWGPTFIQAEWIGAAVDRHAGHDSPFFNGAYVELGWFLTGENREYKKADGAFGKVIPNENFFRVRACDGNIFTGAGAWELLYRYSYLDLTDLGINGGLVSDHTIGVNWYLNPNMRIMFNYINSTVTDAIGQGNMDIFEARTQVSF